VPAGNEHLDSERTVVIVMSKGLTTARSES
jgi:hypothetical protein